jgi:hypothetical protein
VRYPTGAYRALLPKRASDSQSVVYTISNNVPPRSELAAPKVPMGVAYRHTRPRLTGGRHDTLIYTTGAAYRSSAVSGMPKYGIGTILEFGSEPIEEQLRPTLTNNVMTAQHGVDQIDYTQLGLTVQDSALLQAAAKAKYDALVAELNQTQQRRLNVENSLDMIQRELNQLTKAMDAVAVIDDASLAAVTAKLAAQRAAKLAARQELIVEANALAGTLVTLSNRVRAVGANL